MLVYGSELYSYVTFTFRLGTNELLNTLTHLLREISNLRMKEWYCWLQGVDKSKKHDMQNIIVVIGRYDVGFTTKSNWTT